jgi:starvation-inducible DNA-binding protein
MKTKNGHADRALWRLTSKLTRFLRSTHEVCDEHNDIATASLIENWIDETERRTWFLFEIIRR